MAQQLTLQSLHFKGETSRGVLLLLSALGNLGKCQPACIIVKDMKYKHTVSSAFIMDREWD
jgi:hypothetical protein